MKNKQREVVKFIVPSMYFTDPVIVKKKADSPPWSIWGRRCCIWGGGRWGGCRARSLAARAPGGRGRPAEPAPPSLAQSPAAKNCFVFFVNILYFLKSINIYQYVSKTHKGVWRAWARRFVKENMIFPFWRGAWYEYDMKSMAFPSCRAAPSMCCGSEPDMSVEDVEHVEDVRSHEMSSL